MREISCKGGLLKGWGRFSSDLGWWKGFGIEKKGRVSCEIYRWTSKIGFLKERLYIE